MKSFWKWPRRDRCRPAAEARDAPLTPAELEAAVRAAEPQARLVPPRLLRRVIREHCELQAFGFRVPHAKSYVLPRAELLKFVDRDELGAGPTEELPERVILLERPSGEELEEQSREEVLLRYWELLFHARVHAEFDGMRAAGRLTDERLAERAAAIDPLAFEEIRNVLRQERFLLPPQDDTAIYVEFAAVYLGMRCFRPFLLASFFPALTSWQEADRLIAEDVDVPRLLAATRLEGAPEPVDFDHGARLADEIHDAELMEDDADAEDRERDSDGHPKPAECSNVPRKLRASERTQNEDRWFGPQVGRHDIEKVPGVCYPKRSAAKYLRWSQSAARHTARGNLAGAAIRRARAAAWAPREKSAEAATALREAVHHFVGRLLAALAIEGDDPRPWRESLLALAQQTPRGLWTVEARLLYDLQKACIDREQRSSTIDVMQWVLSLGRRPIRRDLPDQRHVAMTRHLHSAERRLLRVQTVERQRQQLAEVLGAATATVESQLREKLRPKVADALATIDLRPKNLPEDVARRKIVEEILDRIVERGFLTLGEVRDAISRNQLKEADCSGPRDFLRGEAALRANAVLSDSLDGVYEPADFYLRWLMRFGHVMFGTFLGRCITKYFIIPFGGAMVGLIVAEHIAHMITRREEFFAPTWDVPASYGPTVLVGIFLLLLIYVPRFRRVLCEILLSLGQAARNLFDGARWFFARPWVREFLRSAVVRLFVNAIVKPLVPTLIVAFFVRRDFTLWQKMAGLGCIYAGLMLVVNSRVGRNLEELVLDAAGESWQRFGARPLLGLFWFFVDLFRRFTQGIERMLYTVDEWLRFRSGQNRATLYAKATIGVVWFFAAWLIRFFVTLFIEPTFNPVKHVPWVTAAHKVMLPMWHELGLIPRPTALEYYVDPFLAWLLAGAIVLGAPGVFGFLVWELTANWRLFAANRAKTLRPAIVGSHGETMLRLLRPGIHSGTIPKQFAKLRRAERKALGDGDPGRVLKFREAIHHVAVAIGRYVDREFIAWFVRDDRWTAPPPQLGGTHLATNQAAFSLFLPGDPDRPLRLTFQFHADKLALEIAGRPCLDDCSPGAQEVFRLALLNLLKTAGAQAIVHRGPEDSPAGSARQEVASLDVPWPDWVAAWEEGGRLGQALDRMRLVESDGQRQLQLDGEKSHE